MSARLRLLACILASLLSATVLFAQSESASIRGSVTDVTGALVPQATVRLVNIDRGTKMGTESNDSGFYTFANVHPGRYRMEVEKNGFKVVHLVGLVVNVQDNLEENFKLDVGAVSESLTVSAEAENVSTGDGTVSTVVTRQFLDKIPLNGRTVQSLITLTPGVVLTKASGGNQGQFSVNGQRADTNYFTVDGVSANIGHSAFMGQIGDTGGSLPGLTATGGTNNLVSVDAMQEFRIQTSSFAPEYGRQPGGQVSIVTRSGTNEFHGTAFEYLRNDFFDANDWFAAHYGLEKAELRANDFGGVFGGPLWRDHTFFFISYEGQRLRLPNTLVSSVPSTATRQAAPPSAKPIFDAFPIPNGPDQPNGLAQFVGAYSNKSDLDATSLRIDHTFNSRVTVFARYNHAPSDFVSRQTNVASMLNAARYTTDTATAGATALITNRMTNEFRANWSRNKIDSRFINDNYGGAVPLDTTSLLPSYMTNKTTQFVVYFNGLYYVTGNIVNHRQRQLNLVDNLTWVRGTHEMKFGVDYRRMSAVYDPVHYTLDYFTSISDILAGNPTFAFATLAEGPLNPIFPNVSLYAQDTWRVTPRLQLTCGLRWDYNPAPHEANGNDPYTVTNVNDPANMALAPRGTPYFHARKSNFAPRIGISYAINQSQRWQTVVRGGFGVFYDLASEDAGGGYAGYPFSAFAPFFSTVPADPATVPQPQLKADPTVPPYDGSILAFDPNLKQPRTYQWNVAVEQQLGAPQTITFAYVGAAGRDLLRQFAYFSKLYLPSSILNDNFTSNVSVITNTGYSNYHALQVEFRRRLASGLQGLASYTWSHSLDNASDNQTSLAPPQQVGPNTDYGSSDFDIRHSFAAAFTYNVPTPRLGRASFVFRDWMLDGIFHAHTAAPVNVFLGTDNLNLGFFATTVARPNVMPGIPLYLYGSQYPGGKIVNNTPDQGGPGCLGPFCTPPAGEQGDLGRNALRGFGAWQLDFGLVRSFKLSERFDLQFRSEFFNIFNHPNFGDPVGDMSQGTFGQSTMMLNRSLGAATSGGGLNPLYQIGGPRSIQFALKLQF